MRAFLRAVADRVRSAVTGRSPKWPAVERAFRKANPTCSACGTKRRLDVHHVHPFHKEPAKELDPANLMTLCRPDHLAFGHFHEWASWNPDVRADVAAYRTKLDHRPKG